MQVAHLLDPDQRLLVLTGLPLKLLQLLLIELPGVLGVLAEDHLLKLRFCFEKQVLHRNAPSVTQP